MAGWKTDADALAAQYADATNLNARAALHERFGTNDVDLRIWQFRQLSVPDSGRILSLGCGDGDFWTAVRDEIPETWEVVLTDVSRGMVREARRNLAETAATVRIAQTDAMAVPFPARTFDAVTANHMLYHVPDRRAALAEIARVLAPDGQLYATTNGAGHMAELRALIEASTGESVAGPSGFTLDNGRDQLEEVFGSVERYDYDESLRVTQIESLVAYALSRPEFEEEHVDRFVALVREQREDGILHVTKNTGLFVARDPV